MSNNKKNKFKKKRLYPNGGKLDTTGIYNEEPSEKKHAITGGEAFLLSMAEGLGSMIGLGDFIKSGNKRMYGSRSYDNYQKSDSIGKDAASGVSSLVGTVASAFTGGAVGNKKGTTNTQNITDSKKVTPIDTLKSTNTQDLAWNMNDPNIPVNNDNILMDPNQMGNDFVTPEMYNTYMLGGKMKYPNGGDISPIRGLIPHGNLQMNLDMNEWGYTGVPTTDLRPVNVITGIPMITDNERSFGLPTKNINSKIPKFTNPNLDNLFSKPLDRTKKQFEGGGDLTQINAVSHDMGGLTLGGGQNEVELNENINQGYVNSDRLRISKRVAKMFGLPKSYVGKTPAKIASTIDKKYNLRDDKMSTEAKQMELDGVKQVNEFLRQETMNSAYTKAYGGKLQYPDGGPIKPFVGYQGKPNKTYLNQGLNYLGSLGLQDFSNKLTDWYNPTTSTNIVPIETIDPNITRATRPNINKSIEFQEYIYPYKFGGKLYGDGGDIGELPEEDPKTIPDRRAVGIEFNYPNPFETVGGISGLYPTTIPPAEMPRFFPDTPMGPKAFPNVQQNQENMVDESGNRLNPWGYGAAGAAILGKGLLNLTQDTTKNIPNIRLQRLSRDPVIQAAIQARMNKAATLNQIANTGSTSGQILGNIASYNPTADAQNAAEVAKISQAIGAGNTQIANEETMKRNAITAANLDRQEMFRDQRYNNWDSILTDSSNLGQTVALDTSKNDMQNAMLRDWIATKDYRVINNKPVFVGKDEEGKTVYYDMQGNLLDNKQFSKTSLFKKKKKG